MTVADLNEEKGLAVANEIGGTFVNADVTDEESVKEAVASAAASADDGLRVCVNCAGVGAAGRIVGKDGAAPFDGYKWAININHHPTNNVLRLAAESMVGNEPDEHLQRGVCINTASIAAFDGQIGQTAYAASKGGVVGLTLPAARDLARSGVRVMTIAPGLFDTPLLALLPEPAEQALAQAVFDAAQAVAPLAAARQYRQTLEQLASLREPVDAFFAAVLVNADDAEVRANRYALLAQLRSLFLGVADISLLG